MTTIVGAGLAGLIAGYVFPNGPIYEVGPAPTASHKALLRFRSDAVSLISGIPFRKVRVRKNIFFGGEFCLPNVRTSNLYAQKVLGAVLPRSIWDIDPVDRFVAPEDLYDRMVEHHASRIRWRSDFFGSFSIPLRSDTIAADAPVVSTAPLGSAAEMLGLEALPKFDRAPIMVQRFRIVDADVHQTVYFPAHDTSTYRASITGDMMIVESMTDEAGFPEPLERKVLQSVFGLVGSDRITPIEPTVQRFGKIAPIDNAVRKELIHRLTTQCGIYSVGRFATWRNILLDDVVQDLRLVKAMIEQSDAYSRALRQL